MRWWACLAWTWPRPTASEAAKRAVLYSAAYGARSTGCTALLLGTVVRTEECLSSLQGQPCLAQTDSMPPAKVPNHSQHSISHSPPPPIPSLLGSHPDQQHLRTSGRRPGVKPSECECECVCVCECGGLSCCGPLGKEPLVGVLPLFGLCCIQDTQMLSGPAAL